MKKLLFPWLATAVLLLMGVASQAAETPYRLGVSSAVRSTELPRAGGIWLTHPSNFGWGLARYANGIESTTTTTLGQVFYSLRGTGMHLDLGLGAGRIAQTGDYAKYYSDGDARERFLRFGLTWGRFGLHLTKSEVYQYLRKKQVDDPFDQQQAGDITLDPSLYLAGFSWDF